MEVLKSVGYYKRSRMVSPVSVKPFKERNSLNERLMAVESIKTKFPSKVPVIVERYNKVIQAPSAVQLIYSSVL